MEKKTMVPPVKDPLTLQGLIQNIDKFPTEIWALFIHALTFRSDEFDSIVVRSSTTELLRQMAIHQKHMKFFTESQYNPVWTAICDCNKEAFCTHSWIDKDRYIKMIFQTRTKLCAYCCKDTENTYYWRYNSCFWNRRDLHYTICWTCVPYVFKLDIVYTSQLKKKYHITVDYFRKVKYNPFRQHNKANYFVLLEDVLDLVEQRKKANDIRRQKRKRENEEDRKYYQFRKPKNQDTISLINVGR